MKEFNPRRYKIPFPILHLTENSEENRIESFEETKIESKKERVPSTEAKTPPLRSAPDLKKDFNTTKYEYNKYICTCDLTKNSCDINCCCDEECSTEDKDAFTGISFILI